MMAQMQDNLLLYSRAYWVTQSLIAWNVDVDDQNGVCYLLSSKDASLNISNSQIQGSFFSDFQLVVYVCSTGTLD